MQIAVKPARGLALLRQSPRDGLRMFLATCAQVAPLDPLPIARLAGQTIQYLQSSNPERRRLNPGQPLEQRWYTALATGTPDWSVYDGPEYLAELWACWIVYSRRYLRALIDPRSLPPDGLRMALGPITRVADLGCGIGYSTAALTGIFPQASVIGTNRPESLQTTYAQHLGREYGFEVVADLAMVGPVDLVFASEYFEHFPAPLAHLREVLTHLQPRALLIANTFNNAAVGHFSRYEGEGRLLSGLETARKFGALLRAAGYQRIPTHCWNNRPTYWARVKP